MMEMNLKDEFLKVVKGIRDNKPLVLHIANKVTAESCADITLAAGGSPMMIDEIAEADSIVPNVDAVVLNIGTLNERQKFLMLKVAEIANREQVPVVLDPVGVMASKYRLEFCLELLHKGYIDIVKGNLSECGALVSGLAESRGIDNTLNLEKDYALRIAKKGTKEFGIVFAVTGAVDYITDGSRAVVLNSGNPLLADITGSGCMVSALVGACAGVTEDYFVAAALGVVIMCQSAELSANFLEKKDGPGMFKARLTDAVYHVTTKFDVLSLQSNHD